MYETTASRTFLAASALKTAFQSSFANSKLRVSGLFALIRSKNHCGAEVSI